MNHPEQKYKRVATPSLMKEFNYKSAMEVPHVDKIVINMSIGEAISNPKVLDGAITELAQITGQVPIITKVKKSIANFKLHEGMPIGCKVTLRKKKIYDFMDRSMNVSLPRVCGFRDISTTPFDDRGDYTLGVKGQLIFPGTDHGKTNKVRSADTVVVTTADTNEKAKALLGEMGMPFKRQKNSDVYGKGSSGQ